MTDLVYQIDIPTYTKIINHKKNPFVREESIIKPPVEEPGQKPFPEEDPAIRTPKEKEPPLSQEDELDPSKNPMEEAFDWTRGGVWI